MDIDWRLILSRPADGVVGGIVPHHRAGITIVAERWPLVCPAFCSRIEAGRSKCRQDRKEKDRAVHSWSYYRPIVVVLTEEIDVGGWYINTRRPVYEDEENDRVFCW